MVQSLVPNLILIGFMGTGKSTIGRLCARALDYGFHDTDARVERRTGRTIAELFADNGEHAFREMEARAVREISAMANIVIATGGGAVLDPASTEALRTSGVLVWLDVEPEEILRRCGARGSRPLLAVPSDPLDHVRRMLNRRRPIYEAVADARVATTGLACEDSTGRVLAAYRALAADWPDLPDRSAEA